MGNDELIRESIIRDMSEGVMVIGLNGAIEYINPAGQEILGKSAESLQGKKFAAVFLDSRENDAFTQTVMDAIYDAASKHYNLVPYYNGQDTRQLHVMSSFLLDGKKKIGVIVVFSDITELAELRIRFAQQTAALLESLVRALSVAIDERSPYNANHTRHMVRMGEAFLDWLRATDNPWTFDEDRRRALLMSISLHDIGKLAVPLEIMDKATRLGPELERIETRFEKTRLLNRIAFLEGRITEDEYRGKTSQQAEWLDFIRRTNTVGFVSDEDVLRVQEIQKSAYIDEDGRERPLLTEQEAQDLLIRKGTLTQEEREIMQSHVSVTGRILSQVEFPEAYAEIPGWATAHHELLNGKGYPNRKMGSEIPLEVHLITILDIFEALTSKDRPYKRTIPVKRALEILHSMADEGSLDIDMLRLFEESKAWEGIVEE